jgi:5-methylcytosine-specific restriction endonuclease McrA
MPLPVSNHIGTCELCGRTDISLTEHHLIPRKVHRKKLFRKQFDLDEMRHRRISVCRRCHLGIHKLIPDEATLAREYNTLEKLLAHEGLQKHIPWVKKQRK